MWYAQQVEFLRRATHKGVRLKSCLVTEKLGFLLLAG